MVLGGHNDGVPFIVTSLIAWIGRSGGVQALISLRTQLSYIGLNTIGRQLRATYKEELKISDVEAIAELLISGFK